MINDPPHIRIRSDADDTEVASVLTIDNFGFSDDGVYHCQASGSGASPMNSTALNFTSELTLYNTYACVVTHHVLVCFVV